MERHWTYTGAASTFFDGGGMWWCPSRWSYDGKGLDRGGSRVVIVEGNGWRGDGETKTGVVDE